MRVSAAAIVVFVPTLIGSASILAASLEIDFRPVTAPAELLACVPASFRDSSASAAEDALASAESTLRAELHKLNFTKAGNFFVRGMEHAQNPDSYPLVVDFCAPIGERPSSNTSLTIVSQPSAPVLIGYCQSIDLERCVSTARAAVTPEAPPGSAPTPASPMFPRYAFWYWSQPPATDAEYIATVHDLTPLISDLTPTDPVQTSGSYEVSDSAPRP